MRSNPFVKALTVSIFLCALFAALQWPSSVAPADSSPVIEGATGGSVVPIWNNVRMDSETVQAVCLGYFAEYRIDFRFVNDGMTRKVKLGFPFTNTVSGSYGIERPVGFQAWQNGRPLTVRTVEERYAQGSGTVGYFVHVAVFPHGATMITVSYLAKASGMAAERPDASPGSPKRDWTSFYQYWLHTGSPWKGPIGKAVVRYRFADSFRGRDIELTADETAKNSPVTAPPGWTRPLPRTYQWQFTDFEPRPDHASDWWKPQSLFDVTLAFTDPASRPPTLATWTRSSVAKGYFGSHGGPVLQDGQLDSCWAEGARDPGIGQWVEARFKRPTLLRELRILPGNNAYSSAFTMFARPSTLKAIFSDGSFTLLHLEDAPTLQRFPVDVTTRSVRFVIRSVYLGTDYPAACISEVEFGTERAPGFAPFRRLIVDPFATGRLTAQAGPPAPAPIARRVTDWQAAQDYDDYAGGDLIGIHDYMPFPSDAAPFKEPASLADIAAKDPALRLPDRQLVGEPTRVSALSYWTYEIRYSSGIDLLVNTRVMDGRRVSLSSELARETRDMQPYTDDRVQPFEVVKIGRQRLGLARAGVLADCSDYSAPEANVPGQVFWRAGDQSYHLYARSDTVTADALLVVARSMIVPPSGSGQGRATVARPAATHRLKWVGLGAAVVAALAAAVIYAAKVRRGRLLGKSEMTSSDEKESSQSDS